MIADYQAFQRWLAGDPARLRIAFRVFNPKRPIGASARSVLAWIATVEQAISTEP